MPKNADYVNMDIYSPRTDGQTDKRTIRFVYVLLVPKSNTVDLAFVPVFERVHFETLRV